MRRQLLLSTLAVAVTAMLLLGIPLAIATNRLIHEEAQQSLEREAAVVLAGVQFRYESGQKNTPEQIAQEFPGRYIEVTLPDNSVIKAGKAPAPGSRLIVTRRSSNNIH